MAEVLHRSSTMQACGSCAPWWRRRPTARWTKSPTSCTGAARCTSVVPRSGASWIGWSSPEKKTQRAAERDRPEVQEEREVFQQAIERVDPARLFYIDEFGFHLNMTPRYARAPSSERAHAAVPFNPGPAITLVMALGLSGAVAPCAFEGAMNGHVFGLYMAEQVIPQLPPSAIVVVDNLSAHHSEDAREALEASGFGVIDDPEEVTDEEAADAPEGPSLQVWFLPPYSPELSAVEEC